MSKEFPFSEIDIKQMEVSIGYYNLEDPIWIRAFAYYAVEAKETLRMTCRPCYRKVLDFIRLKALK